MLYHLLFLLFFARKYVFLNFYEIVKKLFKVKIVSLKTFENIYNIYIYTFF